MFNPNILTKTTMIEPTIKLAITKIVCIFSDNLSSTAKRVHIKILTANNTNKGLVKENLKLYLAMIKTIAK